VIHRLLLLAVAVTLWLPRAATAQQPRAQADAQFDALVKERWAAAFAAAEKSVAAPADRKRIYEVAFQNMFSDGDLRDQSLLDVFTDDYLDDLIREESQMKRAEDVDARASNPATAGFVERSGAPKLLAIASDLSNLVGADKSAITINLNALALLGITDDSVYSAARQYQRHETLRRLSGAVSFGARIPEKDITGLSGVPELATLFDAWSWDVKFRVFGDRDSRARRWKQLTIRQGGGALQAAAVIVASVPVTDAAIAQQVAMEIVGQARRAVVTTIKRSIQASIKVAGTHLSNHEGSNKFSGTFMLDAPLGAADLTANIQYASVDEVRLGVDNLFQIRTLAVTAALTAAFAEGLLADGRSVTWSLSGNASIFQNKKDLPIPAENTFKLTSILELPIGEAAKVPLSVVFSNDPNALADQKRVWSGQVGVSYDFTALKSLFQ
jgi:hypothetical protein